MIISHTNMFKNFGIVYYKITTIFLGSYLINFTDNFLLIIIVMYK